MKIYGKLLQDISTCFKHFLHLETLCNNMNATTDTFRAHANIGQSNSLLF
jgi:hypothetical protein